MTITIELLKPGKGVTVSYPGELLRQEAGLLLVLVQWSGAPLDLGYTTFGLGYYFYEQFYTDRWFNVFEIHSPDGTHQGWYCNITRPASFDGATLRSEDLELDLFVSADRSQILTLDMDEFLARDFATHDPETHQQALAALADLRQRAETGAWPFDTVTTM
ncbi:MAG TPA: DUF402 domain-containing protein [Roseiflexaceae bacterium]|nr:DUF402 domain-containing protein [Roseiflexaceae bacterium]